MGHANISITMDIYAKATEEKKKQALDDLSGNQKFYKNRAEQYRIILFWRSLRASSVPDNPLRKYRQ
jgi:hypothetical protein